MTLSRLFLLSIFKDFNSRPRKEDDVHGLLILERPHHFNSHPRKEDDSTAFAVKPFLYISTHILARRMTPLGMKLTPLDIISTHILTRRMTGLSEANHRRIHISTHILTRRMTKVNWSKRYFNSHPHKEDDSDKCDCVRGNAFQLTSSQGG